MHACWTGKLDRLPFSCPCKDEDIITESKEFYKEDENHMLARNSALVESSGYCELTRIEEIMDFARRSDFSKIGVAFCVGLKSEMLMLNKILTYNNFKVDSIICKNGSIPKQYIGINKEEQIRKDCEFEAMCNPIGQALLLNKAETDLNIIFGLCVGHDSLFIKYSNAPITVLAVKDRVLGHNPISAIYLAEGYHKKRMFPENKKE